MMTKTFICFLLVIFFLGAGANFAESSEAVKTAGDVGAVAVPAAALALAYVHDDKEGIMQLAEALAASAAATYALKYTVNETRPNGEKHSFPSLHTSVAFAGAAFVQQRDGWKYGLPLYVVSALVGASRIEAKEHHFQDVLAGAAIGVGANLIFTKPYHKVTVTPVVENGITGVMIGKSF